MSSYWLWYPTLVSVAPPRIAMFVSWRDLFYLADGTDAFVRTALADVDVAEAVTHWTFQRYRASYFAPDPDGEPDEVWHYVWKLEATLSEVPRGLDPLTSEGRRETDAEDASWRSANDPSDAPRTRCLVIGDFADAASRRTAAAAIARAFPEAALADGLAFGMPQLQVDLGERECAWYTSGADEATRAIELLREHGAQTHWYGTLVRAIR